ncbi:hypothetical protein brsh051_20090 [Brooklawnia propionicigenes]|uniref:Uncharacterized protein n=1 Tax=Brooklawnia propionicigenes TaxID=3041175 RepID=A0AAN0MH88_9ACTN|nr:hypothetical protein brsh051_20090 [Brooklawnia sp. SH051]
MSQPAHGLAAVTEQVPATSMGSLSRRRDTHRGGGNLGSDNTAAPSDNTAAPSDNTIGQTDNTAPQTDNTQSFALSAKETRLKVPANSALEEVLLAAFPGPTGTAGNSTERRALNSPANPLSTIAAGL